MSAIKKIRVLLVQGGPSVEHDISIKSARMVASALDDTRFDYHLVHITRNGKWKFKNNAELPFGRAMMKIERGNFDVAFIALHGTFGEDGKIQSVFEALGLPYIGSGPEASSCALNKATSASIFKENGLTHPNFIHLTNTSQKPKLDRFTFPLVVKPCHGGSSIQISFAKNPSQVWSAAKKI